MILVGVIGFWRLMPGADQEQIDGRIAAYDKGPVMIDVSRYPADIQAKYRVFAAKCSHCHTLARPINCDLALPDEWSHYVTKMIRKPESGISLDDGVQIYDFLIYDSKARKKEILERKLEQQKKVQGR